MDRVPELKFAAARGARIGYQDFGGGDATIVAIPPFAQNVEVAWERAEVRQMLERFGSFARFIHGVPHTFQVLSETARFTTVSASNSGVPRFDRMVAELGERADEPVLPEPVDIDPARVGEVGAANGIEILGPPPAPLD